MIPNPKPEKWRSRAYMDWVKTLPCCNCGQPSDDAHHVNHNRFEKGIGTKVSDCFVVPVCRGCHEIMHIGKTDDYEVVIVAKIIERALSDGVLGLLPRQK